MVIFLICIFLFPRHITGYGQKMRSDTIRNQIIDYIITATEASSLDSVHISKLVKELNINRNTFYYHFDSKLDVALYVFRVDLAKTLTERVPQDYLIEAELPLRPRPKSLPYYMHREIGARLLDNSDFLKALVYCVTARPLFYRKLFTVNEPEMKTRIFELFRPAVEDDVRFVLSGRYMPRETFDFLVSQQLENLYQLPCYHLANPSSSECLLDDAMNPFWNYPYEMLMTELQEHPIKKPRG